MKNRKKIGFAVVGLGAIAQGAVLPAFRHSKRANRPPELAPMVSGSAAGKARRTPFGRPVVPDV